MKPVLLIDCSYIGYRAKYALGGLKKGNLSTGIVFGFLEEIKNLAKRFGTSDFVFCWDSRRSHRKRLCPSYKEKRHADLTKDEREDLEVTWEQFTILRREILPIIGFRNVFVATGFEADDIIAVLAHKLERRAIIIAGDEDMYQLLNYCDMYIPGKNKLMTAQTLVDEHKIPPGLWAKMKAIAGCASDEVKGIKGVGEGTVAKYFNGELPHHYKTYEKIIRCRDYYLKKNIPLVKLPFKGTPDFELCTDDLRSSLFFDLCEEFGFTSFMEGKRKTFWENFFKGKVAKIDTVYDDAKEVLKSRRSTRRNAKRERKRR